LWLEKKALSGYEVRNADIIVFCTTTSFKPSLFGSTYYPVRIRVGFSPTTASANSFHQFSFSFQPPKSNVTLTDGYNYFVSTRPDDISNDEVIMMHEYLFDEQN